SWRSPCALRREVPQRRHGVQIFDMVHLDQQCSASCCTASGKRPHVRPFLCLHSRKPAQRYALRRRDDGSSPAQDPAPREAVPGFTRRYGVDKLMYFEEYESILEARAREGSLKRWRRAWKIALIEKVNPQWRDLAEELVML